MKQEIPPPPDVPPTITPRGKAMVIMLLLLIFGVPLFLFLRQGRMRNRPSVKLEKSIQKAGLDALRSQDPAFDEKAFADRTRAVVNRVNEAWLLGHMGQARRVISDGVYVRFSTQLRLLAADKLRNAMADFSLLSVELASAESDPQWDTVHVKIVAQARDQDLPLSLSKEEGERLLRAAPLSQYQEIWSFVRRRGQHSKQGIPALQGRCPSCGAELPLSEVVRCDYCKALINSGEHDWVLAEITQPEEWRASATLAAVEGLEQLRERDQSVSRQELEDRASVLFWKWIEAVGTDKLDKLARFCVASPVDNRQQLGLTPQQLRQVAVGSAELERIESTAEQDQAHLEIRWSASVGKSEPVGHIMHLTLARSSVVRSQRGLSSLDCPVCGGPLAASDDPSCGYCGTALGGGKHEWSLLAVRPDAQTSKT